MTRRGVTGGAAGLAERLRRAFRSIRAQLALLIAALLLINAVTVYIVSINAYRAHMRSTDVQMTETATALCLALDGTAREAAGALRTLALSPRLAADDLQGFESVARREVKGTDRWVVLYDDQGRRLVDTHLPPGAPLPTAPSALFQAFRSAGASKALYFSDLMPVDRPGPYLAVGVFTPVPRAGRPTWRLGIEVAPSVLQRVLAEQDLPAGWYGTVHDRQGRVVARSLEGARYLGRLSSPDVLAHILHKAEGVFETRSLADQPIVTAFRRSTLTGWTLSVAMPRATEDMAMVRCLALTIALTLALLLSGVALVWLVGGHIAGAIGHLSQSAKVLGRGAALPPMITGLSEIDAVCSSMHEASVVLRDREGELRDREARIRRLVEANIIGIFFWTLDGRVTDANDAFLALLGYDRDDMRSGRVPRWTDMTPPEWLERDRRAIDQLRAQGSAQPYEKEFVRKDGSRVPVLAGLASFAGTREEGVAFVLDLSEQKRSEDRLKLMVDELNHRVKNTLATVMAVAAQSLRTAPTLDAFRRAFQGRLLALSKTHDLLNETFWTGVTLRKLVEQTLAPYAAGDRVVIAGEDVRLGPIAAVTLGMALYELADNAVRYGALSTPSGQVRVSWRRAAPGRLQLDWEELGGPPVQPPGRRGFGSQLIEKVLAAELRGEVRLEFPPQGVRCSMDMALDWVSAH